MKVRELIRLLELMDQDMNLTVGSYNGPHNIGWNETHERSHGPIWVANHGGRCFIGINCYGSVHKNASYRTIKDDNIVTQKEYYNFRGIHDDTLSTD